MELAGVRNKESWTAEMWLQVHVRIHFTRLGTHERPCLGSLQLMFFSQICSTHRSFCQGLYPILGLFRHWRLVSRRWCRPLADGGWPTTAIHSLARARESAGSAWLQTRSRETWIYYWRWFCMDGLQIISQGGIRIFQVTEANPRKDWRTWQTNFLSKPQDRLHLASPFFIPP